jgi:hypothetical protein
MFLFRLAEIGLSECVSGMTFEDVFLRVDLLRGDVFLGVFLTRAAFRGVDGLGIDLQGAGVISLFFIRISSFTAPSFLVALRLGDLVFPPSTERFFFLSSGVLLMMRQWKSLS